MTVTSYHNPKCAKSRDTLRLLEARGSNPRIVEYLDMPLTEAELKSLIAILDIQPRARVRKTDVEYKQARLDESNPSEAEIIRALAKHPISMQRPIVVANVKAALGRPPENALKIL